LDDVSGKVDVLLLVFENEHEDLLKNRVCAPRENLLEVVVFHLQLKYLAGQDHQNVKNAWIVPDFFLAKDAPQNVQHLLGAPANLGKRDPPD